MRRKPFTGEDGRLKLICGRCHAERSYPGAYVAGEFAMCRICRSAANAAQYRASESIRRAARLCSLLRSQRASIGWAARMLRAKHSPEGSPCASP